MSEPQVFGHFRVARQPDGSPIELGRGAMGITYKAFDEKLRIDVALKIIAPAQVGDRHAQALFLREARAAARVRHSNVASVLELDDTPGQIFYAMEYVAGQSLKAWLKDNRPVSTPLAVGLAIQIARGLGAIHEQGIVHRDLKPSNIMLLRTPGSSLDPARESDTSADEWRVKIIDFGIAHTSGGHAETDETTTQTVGFRGTALYASPEQCGEHETIDGRADLYALGCILWEMLLGSPPFTARSQREVMNLHVSVAPPIDRLANLPSSVVGFLERLLMKDPNARYPSAAATVKAMEACQRRLEILNAPAVGPDADTVVSSVATAPTSSPSSEEGSTGHWPRRVALLTAAALVLAIVSWIVFRPSTVDRAQASRSSPPAAAAANSIPSNNRPDAPLVGDRPTTVSRKSIAVLPFENLSADKDNEYFADGVHEDLLTNLAKIRDLKVISRSSVLGYRGKTQNLRMIGSDLGVGSVVEGSVRRAGDKIKVTAQLIDANTDQHIWAENFDGDISDIFAIQRKIAQEIAKAVAANLTPAENRLLDRPGTVNPTAYEYYLKARYHQGREGETESVSSSKNLETAIALLEKAVQIDSAFTEAYVEMARDHYFLYRFFEGRTTERANKLRETALAAIHNNAESADAHIALGTYIEAVERNFPAALAEFEKARQLAPGNARAFSSAFWTLCRLDRWDDAQKAAERAVELSPNGVSHLAVLMQSHDNLAQWAEAEKPVQRVARMGPNLAKLSANYLARFELLQHQDLDAYRAAVGPLLGQLDYIDTDAYCSLTRQFETGLKYWRGVAVEVIPNIQETPMPKSYFIGQYLRLLGRAGEAAEQFKLAESYFRTAIQAEPEDPYRRAYLALILAGLDRPHDARQEIQKALDLAPESKDAVSGRAIQLMGAEVYAMIGDEDRAIGLLEHLTSRPPYYSEGRLLPFRPAWDPLRSNPRFQALMATSATKEQK